MMSSILIYAVIGLITACAAEKQAELEGWPIGDRLIRVSFFFTLWPVLWFARLVALIRVILFG